METVLLLYILPLIGIFAISLLVWHQREVAKATYSTFSVALSLFGLWQLLQLLAYYAEPGSALFLYKVSMAISFFALAYLVLFGILYPQSRSYPTKKHLLWIFLPAILMTVLSFRSENISAVTGLRLDQELQYGIIYYILAVLSSGYMVALLAVLLRKYRNRPAARSATLLLGLAFTFPLVFALVFNVMLAERYPTLVHLFPVSFLLTAGIISYGMIRHRLFDIKTVTVRALAYTLSLSSLAIVYFVVAYIVSAILLKDQSATGNGVNVINIILALLLAYIFQPVKQFFDKVTDKIFFRDRYDSEEFYRRFNTVLTSTTNLRTLLERAAHEIAITFKSDQVFFSITPLDSNIITVGTKNHKIFKSDDIDQLNNGSKLKRFKKIVVRDMLHDGYREIQKVLKRNSVAIVMPIANDNMTLGYLALGEQRGSGYTKRDISVLETISDELVIAIQNSLSVQEVRDLNESLQRKVNEATRDLRHTNQKLKNLDKSKDEFISMASHQLRTPLTAVKGYISMILEEDMGKITKGQRDVLEQAFDSSQRMVFLIGDFLNVSRLQTGKFVLEPSQVNFTKLVGEEVDQLVDTARIRNITLHYERPSADYISWADDNKIRQVMMNFIDNAIFYSPGGSSVDIQLFKDERGITFKVKDHGIGVPKAEQAKLFTKFFRAGNARQQRPDGTGIGIYMAKKVILAHNGTIIFETKEGEGSTFGFKLPLENDPKQLGKQPDTTTSHAKHDSTNTR